MINRSLVRIALVVALVSALALVPAALAGKGGKPGGGGSGTSTFSLVPMDGATQATHKGRITFTVSTSATDRPFVGVRCYQGSNFVYDGYVGYFPDYLYDPWFTLDSPYWVPGVATSCTARLFHYDRRGNQIVLATMSFPVAS